MRSLLCGMSVVLALTAAPAPAEDARSEYSETVELSFPLNAGGEFSLSNRNGSVTLETWDKDEVRIVAEKRMRLEDGAISWLWRLIGLKSEQVKTDEDARKLFEGLAVKAEGDESRRDITTEYPESTSGVNFSVQYNITAPRSVTARIDTTNGNIRLAQVNGDVDVQSTNGAIAVENVAGRTEARSTNGRVELDGVDGTILARTTNGSVSVALAAAPAGEVELRSVNGSVTLTVPDGASFELEADTVHGSASCELPMASIEEESRKELRGRVGDGGPRVSLRTTNGSARVKRG